MSSWCSRVSNHHHPPLSVRKRDCAIQAPCFFSNHVRSLPRGGMHAQPPLACFLTSHLKLTEFFTFHYQIISKQRTIILLALVAIEFNFIDHIIRNLMSQEVETHQRAFAARLILALSAFLWKPSAQKWIYSRKHAMHLWKSRSITGGDLQDNRENRFFIFQFCDLLVDPCWVYHNVVC